MSETISVPMSRVEEVAESLLQFMAEKEEKVAYAQLGAALVLCRLSNPGQTLPSPEQEAKFVEDVMEWVGVYWGAGADVPLN